MGTKSDGELMDLEDRDPNALSQSVQVLWEDIIGEPDGFRSPECAWRVSTQCFNISKTFCYVFLSVVVAPLSALCMGCTFACLAFQHIWCWTPWLRYCRVSCGVTRTFVTATSQAIIVPVCEALGYVFASIKIRKQMLPDGPDHRDDILLV